MHQRHDWELQTWVQSPVLAKFLSWDFSRLKYLGRFQLDCCNGKKSFDGRIQLRIAAVGQSPSGLWYTCVHAKQLLIDPMYVWVEKKKTPYSWDNARYINQHWVKRRKKQKKRKKLGYNRLPLIMNIWRCWFGSSQFGVIFLVITN